MALSSAEVAIKLARVWGALALARRRHITVHCRNGARWRALTPRIPLVSVHWALDRVNVGLARCLQSSGGGLLW